MRDLWLDRPEVAIVESLTPPVGPFRFAAHDAVRRAIPNNGLPFPLPPPPQREAVWLGSYFDFIAVSRLDCESNECHARGLRIGRRVSRSVPHREGQRLFAGAETPASLTFLDRYAVEAEWHEVRLHDPYLG